MKYQSHLALAEQIIPPSGEWEPSAQCWCVTRLAEGQGYWLSTEAARELNAGDVLVLSPARKGTFRASQLSAVSMVYFRFCPDLMSELLTMSERQFFDRASGKSSQSVRVLPRNHPVAVQFAALSVDSAGRATPGVGGRNSKSGGTVNGGRDTTTNSSGASRIKPSVSRAS